MIAFDTWWQNEGSAMRPLPNEDTEEFAQRIACIAWSNGAHCALREKIPAPAWRTTNLSQRDA